MPSLDRLRTRSARAVITAGALMSSSVLGGCSSSPMTDRATIPTRAVSPHPPSMNAAATPAPSQPPFVTRTPALSLLANSGDVDPALTGSEIKSLDPIQLRAYDYFFSSTAPGPGFLDAAVSDFWTPDRRNYVESFVLLYNAPDEAHDSMFAVLRRIFPMPPTVTDHFGDEGFFGESPPRAGGGDNVISLIWRYRNVLTIVFGHGPLLVPGWIMRPASQIQMRLSTAN